MNPETQSLPIEETKIVNVPNIKEKEQRTISEFSWVEIKPDENIEINYLECL